MTAPHSAPDPEESFQPVFGPDFTGEASAAEPDFADLTALAAQLAGTQSAALVLAEAGGLRFLGRHEFPAELTGLAAWLERGCGTEASLAEPNFGSEAGIAFLARIPLAGFGGPGRGMLCVADPQPRDLSPEQQSGLARLARQAGQLLALGRTNRQLEHAARFAGATIDALRANICVLDEHGTILATNASWERFARLNSAPGTPLSSLVGGNYLEVCAQATGAHSAGAAQFAEGIRSVIAGEQSAFAAEYPCDSPTEQRWFLGQATRLGGGAPVRVVVAHEDISERRRVREAELNDKSALIQAIMETSVAAITGVDLAGRIIYANPQAERVLGLTRDALLRREYNSPEWRATAPDGGPLPDDQQPFRRVLASGAPVFDVEHAIDWPDGRRHQLLINGAPIKNDRGEITSLVFSINDITERKLAEQRLQQLSAVVEQSTENILITDRHGVIQYVNRAFERTTGFASAEVLGRTPRILNSGKLPPEFFARLWATIREGQSFSAEFINCRRSGELSYVDQNIAPLRDAAGTITHFVSVGRDTIARRQAEQAIRDEQVINRTLLENLAAIFFVFNREGKILRWNHALEVELGVSGDQLRGSHPLEFVESTDRSVAEQGIRRTFNEGHAQVELHLLGREGRSAPFYVVTRAVELDGEPVLVGLGFDLRERREAEAEIRRLAAFPGLNPEPVLEFAADGSLRYRNQASDALAGALGAGEFARLLPPATADIVRECLATGQPRLRLETVFGEHTLSWSFFPIGEQGRVHGYVSDITDRVRQELLARRSQRLESIGTLAGGIAHDLNNTLTPITMGIQMFRHENPGHSELADAIEQSALRAASMVRQLLTFAKGVGGRRLALDLRQLVQEVRLIVGSTFPKNIELRLDVPDDLPSVVGDPTQLHQVLLNLCVNARDAMPAGGTLTLAASVAQVDAAAAARMLGARTGRFVLLRVTDTGTGIDPAHMERIFEPFFTTKSAEQGTGLGLSNAMGILRGHHGFIHVRSQPGQGATFEVYLPVAETPAASPEDPAPFGRLPAGAGQTVLFVDDERPVSQLAARLLARLGYRPIVVNSAADGLQHLRERGGEIAAIITDLQMPGMDGLEFARAARAIHATVPILVASGRLDDSVAEAFQQLGVHLRLDKPFTAPQLADQLFAALNGSPPANETGAAKKSSPRPRAAGGGRPGNEAPGGTAADGGPQQLQIFPHP
jgi:PAS domain S-box-containing protein